MITASIIFLWLTLTKLPSTDLKTVINVLDNVGVTGLTPFWSFNTFLAYTIPWIFFAVTNPQVVQRIYMPATEKALKNMIKYFSIYGFLYTVLVVIIGLLARVLTEFKVIPFISYRDLVTPTLVLTLDPIPASIILISIIAAAVSTANSIILSVTSSIVRDFYESKLRVSSREVLVVSNIVVITLTVITALIAYLRPGFIVEMSVLSSVILLPLTPITIVSWLGVKDLENLKYGAVTALICGVSIAVYNALIYGPVKAFLTTVLEIPISLWVLTISTSILIINYVIVTRRRRPQILRRGSKY
jgi:SSS family solute:Na+ symporter